MKASRNKDIPEQVMNLILKGFYKNDEEYMKLNLSTDYTIVGIGAPIHVFMDDTAKALNTECISLSMLVLPMP